MDYGGKMIDFEMTADTREELLKMIQEYRARYPNEGYGTTIWVPLQDGQIWKARVVRSASCD